MSSFMKGNRMYQSQNRVHSFSQQLARAPQVRVAVGATGRMQAAELIRQGRARRLGVGQMYCPPVSSGGPPNCATQVQVCPENQKRYYMPFIPDAGFTTSVTAGSEVRFVGRPQKLFAPDRLIVASTIGPYFDIINLIIGNVPQSLAQGPVSAEMFSEVATYVMMTFDQCYPGIDVVITAKNKSSVTQTFQAQLVGEAVG